MTPFLQSDLARDEGLRLKAYRDSLGIWTCGYGHAHVAPDECWTATKARQVLLEDIAKTTGLLDDHVPWWRSLNNARQDVMVNLCFNMGWGDGSHGLSSFHNTLKAIETGDYERAAVGMLASKWAKQVKGRALRLAEQMRTGIRATASNV